MFTPKLHRNGPPVDHPFENMPLGICVVALAESAACILYANRRAALVHGYDAAALVGQPLTCLVPAESRLTLLTVLERAEHGETATAEINHQHRDGTVFPARLTATRSVTQAAELTLIIEDLTAEKQRRSEAEAIEAERIRIAHEIHDGVAQSLAGLRFQAALWSHLVESAPPANVRAALDELQAGLTTAIADLRRAIFGLRPVDLETLGLLPALQQLTTDFGEQNQLLAQLDISALHSPVPTAYELPLFRIIQEGLSNIHHHARASMVRVCLTVNEDHSLTLSLRDNGTGFSPSLASVAEPSHHFGLRQMRERILDLGGTLDILSTRGHGVELRITLPPLRRSEP